MNLVQKILYVCFCLPFTMFSSVLINHWTTQEGMNVFLVEQHELPLVDIQLTLRGGSAQDHHDEGLAYLSAQLIGQGTDRHTSDEIGRTFASFGSRFNREVERDRVDFSLRALSDFEPLNTSFYLLLELVARPNIGLSDFTRVRTQQLAEIQYNQSLPGYLASTTLYQQLYANDPYAHSPLGSLRSVKNLRLAQVIAFYEQYYIAEGASLVFVGDIQEATARQYAKALSKALRPPPKKEISDGSTLLVNQPKALIEKKFDSQQTHIQKGLLVMKENDPDRIALTLFNEILGASSESLMMKVIREQNGLAYGAYSRMFTYERLGPFIMMAQTRNDQASKVRRVMDDLLKRLVESGPSEQEFNAAKQRLLGQFSLLFSSNLETLHILSWMAFYGYPDDYLETYQEQLSHITLDDLKKVVQKRIVLDAVQTVVVGP